MSSDKPPPKRMEPHEPLEMVRVDEDSGEILVDPEPGKTDVDPEFVEANEGKP
jgi:hypothetical protein